MWVQWHDIVHLEYNPQRCARILTLIPHRGTGVRGIAQPGMQLDVETALTGSSPSLGLLGLHCSAVHVAHMTLFTQTPLKCLRILSVKTFTLVKIYSKSNNSKKQFK